MPDCGDQYGNSVSGVYTGWRMGIIREPHGNPMVKNASRINPRFFLLAAALILSLPAGCVSPNPITPELLPSATPTGTDTPTATPPPPTPTPTPSATISPTRTVTRKWPLTIVFYGDSLLGVGEVGNQAKYSFSFVDDLREMLDPAYKLITANYGGRTTTWALANLNSAVLFYHPDSVTLWWGFNDLQGCGGFFNRRTNTLIPDNLQTLVDRHVRNLRQQVDTLLENGMSVVILTSIPIDGKLSWTHFDENGKLIRDNYVCDFNIGLERLSNAQRALAEAYAAEGKSVFLVDAWRIYTEFAGSQGMYLDGIHTGFIGADLIAREWIKVFAQTGEIVKLKEG